MVFCLGVALCGVPPPPPHEQLDHLFTGPWLVCPAWSPISPSTPQPVCIFMAASGFIPLSRSFCLFTSLLWPSHLTTALEPSLGTRGKGKVSPAFIENSPSSLEKLQKYGFNVPFKFWIKKECEATHIFLSGCHFL